MFRSRRSRAADEPGTGDLAVHEYDLGLGHDLAVMNRRAALRGLVGAPGAAMAVYVWHCDREGRYSLYSDGVTGQNYLRGVQTADQSGRWPHVHFEVYDTLAAAVAGNNARLISQIALSAEASEAVYAYGPGCSASIPNMSGVSLESDMVFSDGWDAQMPTLTGSPETGYAVSITIGVAAKDDNAPSTPGGPGGSGGGPGGMPPGPLPNGSTGPSW